MASNSDEQRRFARIEAGLTCSFASDSTSFEGQVSNVSLSGAGVLGPPGAAEAGQSVTLLLERDEGVVSLGLSGTVVRTQVVGEQTLYGVHFDALPPDVHDELVMLLKMIAAGKGQGRRESPRVSARIGVTCKSEERFRAMLGDLSRGGLSVRCSRALEVGEPLVVKFGVEGLPGLVEVSGPVVSVAAQSDGSYRVGMRFTPLPEESRTRVNRLLNVLLELGPRQGVILDDDSDDS